MPSKYPIEVRRQVTELARSGTRAKQLAETFGVSQATVYNWIKQNKIDHGEIDGLSTDQQVDLAAARKRIRQLETDLTVARKVNEVFLREGVPPKRLYPVIEALTGQGLDVGQACLTLGVSRGGYYAWKGRPTSPSGLRRIWLANEIVEIHRASRGTYGEPRVTAELRFGRGVKVGHNTVCSIMKELGIKGIPNRRPPKGSGLAQVTSLDLVKRNFRRAAPNQLWLTDITEHPTQEGKVYCCAVLDAFSRRIVGWSIDSTQTSQLVMNALGMATAKRHPDGELVIHSDRGAQFTS